MSPQLQALIDKIRQEESISAEEKEFLLKGLKDADKIHSLTQFKLDRAEKDRHTLSVMLEETIDDLQKKTKAVEAQNRELEIEAALERVRAVALSMMKPEDMLDVCKMIALQLELLNVKEIRNVQTAIFHDEKGFYTNYEYYAKHNKLFITDTNFRDHPVAEEFANRMMKGPNEVFVHGFQGQEVKVWLDYQKGTNVFIDTYLETADSLTYYWYSLGPVAMGVSTYVPLKEEEIELFKRFRNVFELAYRRYLDIEKAETQAREANIEAALEKVRSKANAMHRSENLRDVIKEVHNQLRSLEFRFDSADFLTDYTDKGYNIWLATADPSIPSPIFVPYFNHRIFHLLNEEVKQGHDFFTFRLAQEEKNQYFRHVFATSLATYQHEESRQFVLNAEGMATSCVVLKNIILSITNFASIPYSEEENTIIKRFAYVFEQSYVRFLDLKKAEAQAREGQIQLALERVRARTMAMQKSDELMEAANLLFQQVRSLGIPVWSCGYNIWEKGEKVCTGWMSTQGVIQPSFRIPLTEHRTFIHMNESRLKDEPFYVEEVSGEELADHYRYMFSLPDFKEIATKQLRNGFTLPLTQVNHVFNFKHGNLIFLSAEALPEAWDIFKRFTAVFEQTYTRFLDLQKAEEQAREAQIEAALEKVRSTSLAMHHSDELEKVVVALFDKLLDLGIPFHGALIYLFEKEKKNIQLWVASNVNPTVKVNLPYDAQIADNPIVQDLWTAIEEKKDVVNRCYTGKVKNDYYRYVAKYNESKIQDSVKEMMLAAESWTVSFAAENNSAIGIDSFAGRLTSQEDFQIVKRFAKVFEQAYTRFLDLQKAEAQARESQIETALEKVRARSMGMQKSDELKEVIQLVYQQFVHLNIHIEHTGFIINYKEREDMNIWLADQHEVPFQVSIPYFDCAHWNSFIEAKQTGKDFFTNLLPFEEKNKFYHDLFKLIPGVSKEAEEYYLSCPGLAISTVLLDNIGLYIENFSGKPFSDEENNTLIRFGKVFQQTYTRFLDLQKAEAQARESQIQLALERVRARTMAMQKSNELSETVFVLFQQFKELGENPDQATIGVVNEEERVIEYWVTMYGKQMDRAFKFSIDEPHVTNKIYSSWRKGDRSLVIDLTGKELYEFTTYRESMGGAKRKPEEKRRVINVAFFSKGLLNVQSNEARSGESIHLLERFAAVFEQTYTRFIDLQKAETQAREAKIEAALERVRARAMAMHKSEELKEVANELRKQLGLLGQKELETCAIHLYDESPDYLLSWAALLSPNVQGEVIQARSQFPKRGVKIIEETLECYGQHKQDYVLINEGAKAQEFLEMLSQYAPEIFEIVSMSMKGLAPENMRAYWAVADFPGGSLVMTSMIEPDEDSRKLLRRFANVFGLAYRRFTDLKNAEAQARESQVQLAFERARAQSMMMQHSGELDDTLRVFHEQVLQLGIPSAFSFLWLPDEEKDKHIFWAAWAEDNLFKSKAINYPLDRNEPATAQCLVDWKSNEPVVSYHVPPEGVKNYFAAWSELIADVEQLQPQYFSNGLYYVEAFIKYGCFGVMVKSELPEEEKTILSRFAIEFERTYTRFLDLQKAEAQAREAQIEAALEKVRSRSLAMHRSDELQEVVHTVFERLRELNVQMYTAIIIVFTEGSKDIVWWMQNKINQQYSRILIKYTGIPYLEDLFDAKEKRKELFSKCYVGEEKFKLYDYLFRHTDLKTVPEDQKKFLLENEFASISVAFSQNTAIHLTSYSERSFSDEDNETLKRFAKVFDQAYTRFIDLQKSEAQAREAQIEAALERVRSRTLAMQKSDELGETAAVLFRQLILLGIEPNRLYINIIKDESGEAEFWITDEDGSKITLAYTANLNDNPSFKRTYDGWKKQKKSLIIDIQGKELKEYFKHLNSLHVPFKGGLSQKRRLQYVAYFNKGFIGMASPDEQPAEAMQLLERFAAVFNLTFTRFNDLKIAEAHAVKAEQDLIEIKAARKHAEEALVELQATQKQLIQSEKMASLGELTAGIAHEIQNPLNFVNNFSDVSNELLEEMKTELEKGNKKDVIAIVDDVKQNLEKILFHGKRADAIVKGMLQHSRTSSSQKELTDINTLADEYVRLAYHGLRAKDKSFNAKFTTDLDKSIGKINVIPQEIGRVILNLINNAFYAVNERQKGEAKMHQEEAQGLHPTPLPLLHNYEPIVSVTTKKDDDKLLITVADNGNGIPQKNMDKIFQPFFTTKPTGQGTGLGLSLAYDIITKGHGGDIKIETKEGEGSKFIVIIPSTS